MENMFAWLLQGSNLQANKSHAAARTVDAKRLSNDVAATTTTLRPCAAATRSLWLRLLPSPVLFVLLLSPIFVSLDPSGCASWCVSPSPPRRLPLPLELPHCSRSSVADVGSCTPK